MRQLLADVDRFAQRCEMLVLPPLCPLAINTFNFSHTAEPIQRAGKLASEDASMISRSRARSATQVRSARECAKPGNLSDENIRRCMKGM